MIIASDKLDETQTPTTKHDRPHASWTAREFLGGSLLAQRAKSALPDKGYEPDEEQSNQ